MPHRLGSAEFLPVPNHPERRIVQDDEHYGNPFLDGNGELLSAHKETSVSRDAKYRSASGS